MDKKYFSIKMRASRNDTHLSGAERIVKEKEIKKVLDQLYKRGFKKNPDNLTIKIEEIKKEIKFIQKTLKIENLKFKNQKTANEKAIDLISNHTGIKRDIVKFYIDLIHNGASPDRENMRGAMIVNTDGERIEFDKYRGIRTVLVDYENREKAVEKFLKNGYTERTADALALTTKNLNYPDMIAEYCISDEADYTTGYVSIGNIYYRFIPLKEKGNKKGGRIYFVKNSISLKDFYDYLQKEPVLIKDVNFE